MHIFIDTNVFLSFYHLSGDDLEELKKLSSLLTKPAQAKLYLPEQVQDEFERNREAKIKDGLKRLQDVKVGGGFPAFVRDYAEHAELQKIIRDLDSRVNKMSQRARQEILSRSLAADRTLEALFERAVSVPTSAEILAAAKLRHEVGNPPGKKESLGDAINWEALLAKVPTGNDVHVISADGDYVSALAEAQPHPFLSREWKKRKGGTLFLYRSLSAFFKAHFPNIKLASELAGEFLVNRLSASTSFYDTHGAIARLAAHGDFTPAQASELATIALDNSQVSWILMDEDVSRFYRDLLKAHREKMDPALVIQLERRLAGKPDVGDWSEGEDEGEGDGAAESK